MPPFAIPSLELNRKDDPGIWPECGAVSIKAWFCRRSESLMDTGLRAGHASKKRLNSG